MILIHKNDSTYKFCELTKEASIILNKQESKDSTSWTDWSEPLTLEEIGKFIESHDELIISMSEKED